MCKKILLVLAAIVGVFLAILAGFLVVVAMQPADWKVERSATIAAPPATVFAQVNDFHNWEAWSPWAKLDPNATYTYAGPEAGVGAQFSWKGNSDVGAGGMTITESQPPQLIRLTLDFIEPFPDSADVAFTFQPEGQGTQVTWTMSGQNNFLEKAVCMFMDMDKMIGGDFEKGLAAMKTAAEAANKQ